MTRSLRLRSLLVSVVTTIIDAGLFAICTLLLAGIALLGARWICGAIGAVCNFLFNRVWAFHADDDGPWRQAGRYGVTALASVTLATALWIGLRLLTGWDPRLLHLVSLGSVWLAFSFPMLRGWVFRREARA